MSHQIHIVTDSTGYLPLEWLERYPFLHVVPLTVEGKNKSIEDWEQNNDEFLRELETLEKNDALPTTSQPSPGKFIEVFEPAVKQGCEVVALIFSAEFSGTYESACIAAEAVDKTKIDVINTRTSAPGLRLLVADAVEAVLEGKKREEIVSIITGKLNRIKVLLSPDDLKYLYRGGRIGGASALVGTILNIKPVLYINEDGKIDLLDKVRTTKKMYKRMVEELPAGAPRVVLAHFRAEDKIAELYPLVEAKIGREPDTVCGIGPVITTHVGPGVIGLIFEEPC